ncbi:MAG: hypothetical protein JSW71_05975 [Gemmatimonadota bacterium]|nr:MAG: hypothetical protein JSW71_05975 [Gemmatimonadota bacterium]
MRDTSRLNRALLIMSRLFAVLFLSSTALVAAMACQQDAVAQWDYDEVFYSVEVDTFDSDYDGYDDSVTLSMDVDTDGGWVEVTVDAYLEDQYGDILASDSATWTIYGSEAEYGQVQLTLFWGDPGEYDYVVELYDDVSYIFTEDSRSGSVYLYPVGYGDIAVVTPTRTPTRTATPTPTPGPGPGPDDGGFNWYILAGVGVGGLLIAAGVMQRNRRMQRGKVTGARIDELKAKMEKWRSEGYDVSDLEDLLK